MHGPDQAGEHLSYAIRKTKTGSRDGGKIVEVIKGRAAAEMAAERYRREMTPEERAAGWRFSLERTGKRPPAVKAEERKRPVNSPGESPEEGSL